MAELICRVCGQAAVFNKKEGKYEHRDHQFAHEVSFKKGDIEPTPEDAAQLEPFENYGFSGSFDQRGPRDRIKRRAMMLEMIDKTWRKLDESTS